MPVVHAYKDRPGYFVRTRIRTSMVTFQVTPDGILWLTTRGVHDGVKTTSGTLVAMINRGWALTGGSGPGDVDDYEVPRTAPVHPATAYRSWATVHQGLSQPPAVDPPRSKTNPLVDWEDTHQPIRYFTDEAEQSASEKFESVLRGYGYNSVALPAVPSLTPRPPLATERLFGEARPEDLSVPTWMYALFVVAVLAILVAAWYCSES